MVAMLTQTCRPFSHSRLLLVVIGEASAVFQDGFLRCLELLPPCPQQASLSFERSRASSQRLSREGPRDTGNLEGHSYQSPLLSYPLWQGRPYLKLERSAWHGMSAALQAPGLCSGAFWQRS